MKVFLKLYFGMTYMPAFIKCLLQNSTKLCQLLRHRVPFYERIRMNVRSFYAFNFDIKDQGLRRGFELMELQNCDLSKLVLKYKSRASPRLLSKKGFKYTHKRICLRHPTLTGHSFAAP